MEVTPQHRNLYTTVTIYVADMYELTRRYPRETNAFILACARELYGYGIPEGDLSPMPAILTSIDTRREFFYSAPVHKHGVHKELGDLGLLTPPDSPLPASICKPKGHAQGGRAWVPEPASWERFKQLVDSEDLEPLGRSLETHTRYLQHMSNMKLQYGSVANFLTTHVLADFISKTKAADFDPSSPITVDDFTFRINDFPYYLGDGVQHWVLWCCKRLSPGFDAPEAAKQAIKEKFGANVEWRYFVNPVAKQSVPQLSHAHVFIKPLNDA